MPRPACVYLAGPDVFLADAADVGEAKRTICARYGLEGRFPLDAPLPDGFDGWRPADQAQALYDACRVMMDGCAAGLANLTPFRGASADVGTAFELGYLVGQGKPVFAYSSEALPYHRRVSADGHHVERYGLADNLMLEGAVVGHGHGITCIPSADGDRHPPLAAMAAFEACVALAARRLGTSTG